MGDTSLAASAGVDDVTAAQLRKAFNQIFPDVARYRKSVLEESRGTRVARTISGRLRSLTNLGAGGGGQGKLSICL